MQRRGPDSLEGWFIAVICCLITTLMYGASGLSGMLFVASKDRFRTDRDKASFPYILNTVLQAVSGPFVGYLANRFGSRVVVFFGSILGFLGIGTCFFAEDILTITWFWGVVFGTGFGLSSLLLPVIINEYFVKHRSLALGMSYLGSPLGFFIFPPIFEVLLFKYGLSGTFLILAGINMHCLPLSLLLKQPHFKMQRENSPLKHSESQDSYLSAISEITNLSQDSKIENKKEAKLDNEATSFARRHSIEFLSGSNEQVTNKKYVLSLNKKISSEDGNLEIQRSFRKNGGNIYENSDKRADESLHHALYSRALKKVIPTETALDNNDKNSNYLKKNFENYSPKYEKSFSKNVTIHPKTHLEDKMCQLCQNLKTHGYEEVSTIYFGTDYKPYAPIDYKLHVKESSDRKNEHKTTENTSIFSTHMKYDSIFDSRYPLKGPVLLKYRKVDDFLRLENSGVNAKQHVTVKEPFTKNTGHVQNLLLDMYLNPIFILICIINAIVNLHFTTMTTIIIDFSRDHNIDVGYEKYTMMGMSIAGFIGMLGFGWVTDGGYLTRTKFGSFTQLITCICTAILPFTLGYETLMGALLIWCVCLSTFIPLIPAITADYFDEDIQVVAISAVNVLTGPLYLIIPPLIGYFRDERGSYDNIFFLLSTLAFFDSIIVFIIPYIVRCRSKKR